MVLQGQGIPFSVTRDRGQSNSHLSNTLSSFCCILFCLSEDCFWVFMLPFEKEWNLTSPSECSLNFQQTNSGWIFLAQTLVGPLKLGRNGGQWSKNMSFSTYTVLLKGRSWALTALWWWGGHAEALTLRSLIFWFVTLRGPLLQM